MSDSVVYEVELIPLERPVACQYMPDSRGIICNNPISSLHLADSEPETILSPTQQDFVNFLDVSMSVLTLFWIFLIASRLTLALFNPLGR